jgi:AraC-like DNA-binding protein
VESPVDFRRWDSAVIRDLFLFDTTEHDLVYAYHLHDAMEILWVRCGFFEVFYRGNQYLLHAGDAMVIAPNEVHAGGAFQHLPFRFASLHVPRRLIESHFDLGEIIGCGRQASAPVCFLSGHSAERLYRQLICGLPTALTLDDQITCLKDALHALYTCMSPTFRLVAPHLSNHPAVRRVRASITQRESESLDIVAVARECGLHPRYLISLFKDVVGLPPHQYQIAQRIDFARGLLDGDLSLSAVASTAGFSDQSHFNRFFKRAYGMTPGAYRIHTIPLVQQH